jgi:hypothetical protein
VTAHRIGVLGAGTMGAGIVQVAAEAGLDVLVHDPVEGAFERARERIGGRLLRRVDVLVAPSVPTRDGRREGIPVEFRKQIASDLRYDTIGESVGFFRFSEVTARRLAARCQTYLTQAQREAPHEEAIRDLILEAPTTFGIEDITGLPWIEIDFPQDVVTARQKILPHLQPRLKRKIKAP